MISNLHLSSGELIAIVAILCSVVIAHSRISLWLRQREFQRQHGTQPLKSRYPIKDPIFAIDNMLVTIKAAKQNKVLELLNSRFIKYGTTFGTRIAQRNVVTTIEPENVKSVLSLRFKDFSLGTRPEAFAPLLGRGIFTTDGAFWAHSRAMIRPNFTKDQVADLPAFERHMQEMLKLIPKDGSTVDLQELFFRMTIDSSTEFLFGVSTDTLKDTGSVNDVLPSGYPSGAAFANAFNASQNAIAMRTRLGIFAKFKSDKVDEKNRAICHAYLAQYVDEALRYREKVDLESGKEEKYVFLHTLAKDTKDKKRLQDELLNVLLAGRDTTASLLSNMFFMLAKNPKVFNKLRQEVEETFEGELPTYEKLRGMKYLKYCLNESLRLHPVVPVNSRLAVNDTFLPLGGGPDGRSPIFIPKGHVVSYSTYAMHRRKDYFGADADEFRPERWETLRPGWEYLPFNGGPRICLGQQYALTEAGYVTTRLCQEFRNLESRDSGPWEEGLTLTLCSKNGTQVGLTPA